MSSETAEETFIVGRPLGLHARPAGQIAKLASTFDCDLQIGRGGEWVSARSVLSILSLAATQHTELHVRGEGEAALEGVRALGALIEAPDDEPLPA